MFGGLDYPELGGSTRKQILNVMRGISAPGSTENLVHAVALGCVIGGATVRFKYMRANLSFSPSKKNEIHNTMSGEKRSRSVRSGKSMSGVRALLSLLCT